MVEESGVTTIQSENGAKKISNEGYHIQALHI